MMPSLGELQRKPTTRQTKRLSKGSSVDLNTGAKPTSEHAPKLDTPSPSPEKNLLEPTDPKLIGENLLRSECSDEPELLSAPNEDLNCGSQHTSPAGDLLTGSHQPEEPSSITSNISLQLEKVPGPGNLVCAQAPSVQSVLQSEVSEWLQRNDLEQPTEEKLQVWLLKHNPVPSFQDTLSEWLEQINLEPDELFSHREPSRDDFQTSEHPAQPQIEPEITEWLHKKDLEPMGEDLLAEWLQNNMLEPDELTSLQEPFERNLETKRVGSASGYKIHDWQDKKDLEPTSKDLLTEWLENTSIEPNELVSLQKSCEQLMPNDWHDLEPSGGDVLNEWLKNTNLELARNETPEHLTQPRMKPDNLGPNSKGKCHKWNNLEPTNKGRLVQSCPLPSSITTKNLMVPGQVRVPGVLHDADRRSAHILHLVSPELDRRTVPISLSPGEAQVYRRRSAPCPCQGPNLRNYQQRFQFLTARHPPAVPTFSGNLQCRNFIRSHFIRCSSPSSPLHRDLRHQTNKNFRLWQMFCRLAKFIHSSSPDVEALSCFLVSSFTSWSKDLTFCGAVRKALSEWKKISNYQRMDYYHMAQTFMEFEEEELKLIMVEEEPKANRSNRRTKGNQKTQRRPASPHNETMNVEDLEEKALNKYMEMMKDLELSTSQGSEEMEAEDEVDHGTFSEYLNELCSQEEFVTKVGSIIDLAYLSSLLSSDPFSTDQQQEDQSHTQGGPEEAVASHADHPALSESIPDVQPGYFTADGAFNSFPPGFKVSEFLSQVTYTPLGQQEEGRHVDAPFDRSPPGVQIPSQNRPEASPEHEQQDTASSRPSPQANGKTINKPEENEVEMAVSQILTLLSEPSPSEQISISAGDFERYLLPEFAGEIPTEKLCHASVSEHEVEDGSPTSLTGVALLIDQASTCDNNPLEITSKISVLDLDGTNTNKDKTESDVLTDLAEGLSEDPNPGLSTDLKKVTTETLSESVNENIAGQPKERNETGESKMTQRVPTLPDRNTSRTVASTSEKTWPKETTEKTNGGHHIVTRSARAKLTGKKNLEILEAPTNTAKHGKEVRTKSGDDPKKVNKQNAMKVEPTQNLDHAGAACRKKRLVITSRICTEMNLDPLKELMTKQVLEKAGTEAARRTKSQTYELRRSTRCSVLRDRHVPHKNQKGIPKDHMGTWSLQDIPNLRNHLKPNVLASIKITDREEIHTGTVHQHQGRRYRMPKSQDEAKSKFFRKVPQTGPAENRKQKEETGMRTRKAEDARKDRMDVKLQSRSAEAQETPKVFKKKDDSDGPVTTRRMTEQEHMERQRMITQGLDERHQDRRYRMTKTKDEVLFTVAQTRRPERRNRGPKQMKEPEMMLKNIAPTAKISMKLRNQMKGSKEAPGKVNEKSEEDSEGPSMIRRKKNETRKKTGTFTTGSDHQHQDGRYGELKNQAGPKTGSVLNVPQTRRSLSGNSTVEAAEIPEIRSRCADPQKDTTPMARTSTKLRSRPAAAQGEPRQEEGSEGPVTQRKLKIKQKAEATGH